VSPVAAPRSRRPALRLLDPVSTTGREVAVAGALLCLLGISVYLGEVIHGGLYADDWSLGALYRFPSPSGHLSDFLAAAPARPVQAVYLLATFAVLGMSAPAQLSAALMLALLASLLFYAVLRSLGVIRLHAWLIAALALLVPASDATRLWADASPALLSVCLYCSGLLLALRAFRGAGPGRRLPTHAASLILYALSITTYETTALLRVHQDIGRWEAAAAIRAQVLSAVHASLPHVRGPAVVYVTGYNESPYANIGSFDFPLREGDRLPPRMPGRRRHAGATPAQNSSRSSPTTIGSSSDATRLIASRTPGMNDSRSIESWRIVKVCPTSPRITS
jgi:hypothetical protein